MLFLVQIALAILYFMHLPALASVPAFLFFVPVILVAGWLLVVLAFFLFALAVAVLSGKGRASVSFKRNRPF